VQQCSVCTSYITRCLHCFFSFGSIACKSFWMVSYGKPLHSNIGILFSEEAFTFQILNNSFLRVDLVRCQFINGLGEFLNESYDKDAIAHIRFNLSAVHSLPRLGLGVDVEPPAHTVICFAAILFDLEIAITDEWGIT